MKFPILCLLAPGQYTFSNMPNITSITRLFAISTLFGAKVSWTSDTTVEVDSTHLTGTPPLIPSDLFYHTSGAIFFIPILCHLYGQCTIQIDPTRTDTGGDQLGRSLDFFNSILEKIGISVLHQTDVIIYRQTNTEPISYNVPDRGHGVSVMLLFAALTRPGISTLHKPCEIADFTTVIHLLQAMGANIITQNDKLSVNGTVKLHSTDFTNLSDRHEFVTFLSAALTTESELSISGVDHSAMKLSSLDTFLSQSGVHLEFNNKTQICHIPTQALSTLKPVNLLAHEYPHFVTEWQVLLSPLFARLSGQSTITEGWYTDRLGHWLELGKMSASYTFFTNPEYPEKDAKPRAVHITGVSHFTPSSNLQALDLRTAAALIIAALSASGQSTIHDPNDNLLRGYQAFPQKLTTLGATIKTS